LTQTRVLWVVSLFVENFTKVVPHVYTAFEEEEEEEGGGGEFRLVVVEASNASAFIPVRVERVDDDDGDDRWKKRRREQHQSRDSSGGIDNADAPEFVLEKEEEKEFDDDGVVGESRGAVNERTRRGETLWRDDVGVVQEGKTRAKERSEGNAGERTQREKDVGTREERSERRRGQVGERSREDEKGEGRGREEEGGDERRQERRNIFN
tara:strand:+ start:219 stop:845 length:627 start_codon:yes stop_codon:yes gene_type:complete